ncbi:MAG: hypothetical protein EBQ85_05110 [Proteobacteria bacterium]|nr:hypothetical protein [Pseudomonadota bacterium]
MSLRNRLKADLKKISELTQKLPQEATVLVEEVSAQLSQHEKKVRAFVKDVDLKGRKAKEKSRKQVDAVAKQIRRTRKEIEGRVKHLVELESEKLNKRVNQFLNKLLSAAQAEKKTKKPRKRKATRKKSSAAQSTEKAS